MSNKINIFTFALLISCVSMAQGVSNNIGDDVEISVYPNPAVETLFIDLKNFSGDPYFELTSMIGTKVVIRPEAIGANKYKLTVKNLSSGYYFLVVKDKEKRLRKSYKFLKR